MKAFVSAIVLVASLCAAPARAGIGDLVPTNPCPDNSKFKLNQGVLNVNGDGSLGNGCTNGVIAETAITCTSKEKAGKTMDVAIEYFDAGGATISASPLVVSTNVFCDVAAGQTITFHTVPPASDLPLPWGASAAFPGFIPTTATTPISPCTFGTTGCFLHGSARVLSTSTKLHCTATFIDIFGPCTGLSPGTLATKNLTIIKKAKQQGD